VTLTIFVSLAILLPSVACMGQTISPGPNTPHTEDADLPPESRAATLSFPNSPSSQVLSRLSSDAQTITIEEAIAMAERSSSRLHGAAAATARATAAIRTAHAYTNPTIEVYEGRQYKRPIATPGVPGLLQHYAATQAIEIPRERQARVRVAQLSSTGSKFEEKAVTLSVVSEVKHAFYNVLRRREEIQHQQENLQLVEDLRRRVETEVRVGEKGRLELTRAEAELAQARYAVRSAQIEFSNAIALLRVAIAAPADANLNPAGTLEPPVTLPSLAGMRDQVLRTHPAMAQSQANVQTAQATLSHEQTLRIPRPTLFTEFENQPDLRYWRAGVSIPIPLWDRRQGQIGEAAAAISQSSAILDQRRLELISATERAYAQYQLADQQASSLESGELRAAESAVDAAKAAYRFGERGIVEVLDAQRVLQSVRGDLLDAQFARQSALTDLEELGAIAPGEKP
jgi:cobalt-zinc-cadmium efflux system outer membrane protein